MADHKKGGVMPRNLVTAFFDDVLKKPSSNREQAQMFLTDGLAPTPYIIDGLDIEDGFELYSKNNETSIRLIDHRKVDDPRIAYAVKVQVSDEKIGLSACTQVMVWANPRNEEVLLGFPRKIFNHLLEKHVIMITDKEQTPDGKRFWERRISNAFEDGLFVYYNDASDGETNLQLIPDEDEFFETYEPLGWGDDPDHMHKMFIISKHSLI
ncbi:hypothetical protein P3697_26995 [Vibrio parahaemolyticus]|nr:hypothetical protein [Vibrio parahaemolyticus]MDF5070847.1 hypothetical protein [Vibrio parahaemolyticus]MDF5305665.1 hypothetical protein [Vibrio parahaemolyticus]